MAGSSRFAVGAVVLVVACGDEDPELMGDAEELDQVGDPCNSGFRECVDDDRVFYCDGGTWTIGDCAEVCVEVGTAFVDGSCVDENDGEEEEGAPDPWEPCVCVLSDPDGCSPGVTTCADESTLETCNEDQELLESDCSGECAAVGLTSLGCAETEEGVKCLCTIAGQSCEPEDSDVCVDDSNISTCEDGVWVVLLCDDVCSGPATCDPWGSEHACDC